MNKEEFRKIQKILAIALQQAEKEAIEDGVDIRSSEYDEALSILREKILENLGLTTDEYEELRKSFKIPKKPISYTELIDTPEIPVMPEIPEFPNVKEMIDEAIGKIPKPTNTIVNKIVKETIVEKPVTKIVKEKEVIIETDRTDLEELRKDLTFLQEEFQRIPSTKDWTTEISDLTWRIDNLALKGRMRHTMGDAGSFDNAILDSRYYKKSEAEPILPATPENPSYQFLNGLRQWATISVAGGISTAPVYFTTIDSAVPGYEKLSYIVEPTETELVATIPVGTTLLRTYLYDDPIGVTVIDAGSWIANFRTKVSSASQETSIKFEAFLYHLDTTLFSVNSDDINNTDYTTLRQVSNQPSFSCVATDRLGIRISGVTTRVSGVTLYTVVGDGNGSYFNLPLPLRHNMLRAIQGGTTDEYYHLTSTEYSGNWGAKNLLTTGTLGAGATTITSNTQTPLLITGSLAGYMQLNLKNTNSTAGASSDLVITADNGTETTHYVDLGINNSGGGVTPFSTAGQGYLYVPDSSLNIGSLGSGSVTRIYAGGTVASPTLVATFAATGLTLGTDLAVSEGGTGRSSNTAYALIAGGTSTTTQVSIANSSATGRYLRSAGTSAYPVWSTLTLPNAATQYCIPYATTANTWGESVNLKFDGILKVINTAAAQFRASYSALIYTDFRTGSDGTMTISTTGGTAGDIIFQPTGAGNPAWLTSTGYLIVGDEVNERLKFDFISTADVVDITSTTGALVQFSTQLKTNGGRIKKYIAVTATYAILTTDEVIDCTANTFTVTLPTAVGATQEYVIKNSGTGTITIDTTSSQTIDGSLTEVLSMQYGTLKVMSNGSGWMIIH
jgi:hypothetical protein